MQNIQNYLIGGVSAVTSVLNDVVTCRKNNSAFELKKGHAHLLYALTLLGYSFYEISMRRRFALRPHVNPAYRNVCRHTQPLSSLLFGDNLPQSLENIGKGNKIKNKLQNARYFANNRGGFGNRGSWRKRVPGNQSRFNSGNTRRFNNRQFTYLSQDRPRTHASNYGRPKNFRGSNNSQTEK